MAADTDGLAKLLSATLTTIPKLGPHLTLQGTRAVRGEVTVVWPYSSIKKLIAFTIAEPDPLLRGKKGQIRVNFSGACAQDIVDAGVASGDEVLLSLEGAEWERYTAPRRMAEASSDWQLKFTARLLVQINCNEPQSTKVINFYGSAAPAEPAPIVTPIVQEQRDDTPLRDPTPAPTLPDTKVAALASESSEYSSPAFLKRARISYGSLFEDGLDIFDEDEEVNGRGTKRTRFGRDSTAWRYSSQSRSPERDPTPFPPEEMNVDEQATQPLGTPAVITTKQEPQRTEGAHQGLTEEAAASSSTEQGVFGASMPAFGAVGSVNFSSATGPGIYGAPQQGPSGFVPPLPSMNMAFDATNVPAVGNASHGVEEIPISDVVLEHGHTQLDTTAVSGVAHEVEYQEPIQQTYPHGIGFESTGMNFDEQNHSTEPSTFASQSQPSHWATASPLPQIPVYPSLHVDDGMGAVTQETQAAAYEGMAQPSFAQAEPEALPRAQMLPPPAAPRQTTQIPFASGTEAEPFMISSDVESSDGEEDEVQERGDAVPEINARYTTHRQTHDRETEDQGISESEDDGTEDGVEVVQEEDDWQGSECEYEADAEGEGRVLAPGQEEDVAGEAVQLGRKSPAKSEDVAEGEVHDSEEDESEEGDDYDMRNYADVQDDEEDVTDESEEDDEEMEGQVIDEEELYDHEEGADDEELYGDGNDEEEEEELEDEQYDVVDEEAGRNATQYKIPTSALAPTPAPAPGAIPTRSGPVFISLLSDSEDESHDTSAPPPAAAKNSFRSSSLGSHDESSDREGLSAPFPPPALAVPVLSSSPPPGSDEEQEEAPRSPSKNVSTEKRTPEADVTMVDAPPAKSASPIREEPSPPHKESEKEIKPQESKGIVETGEMDAAIGLAEDERMTSMGKPEKLSLDAAPRGDVTAEYKDADADASIPPSDQALAEEQLQAELEQQLEEESSSIQSSSKIVDGNTDSVPTQQPEEDMRVDRSQTNTFGDGDLAQERAHFKREEPDVDDDIAVAAAQGLASPPLTQPMDIQGFEALEKTASEGVVTASPKGRSIDQLPTPLATQVAGAHASQVGLETDVAGGMVQEEITVEPEQEDTTVHTEPTRKSGARKSGATRRSKRHPSPAEEKGPSLTLVTSSQASERTPSSTQTDVGITVKSLRSRGHQRKTSDKAEAAVKDFGLSPGKPSVGGRRAAKTTEGTPPPPRPSKTPRSKTKNFPTSHSPESEEDNSIILAKASLRSPSKKERRASLRSPSLGDPLPEHEKTPVYALKSLLNENLQHKLQDVTALKNLRHYAGKTVSVLGVALRQPADAQRPKHGPRDYKLEVSITDQSEAPNSGTMVHIYRPHKAYLPVIRQGDVVLLRSFAIVGMPKQGFGLKSTQESSWAVYEHDHDDDLPQVKGPPIDISDQETEQAVLLRKWYAGLDAKTKEKLDKASHKLEEALQS